MAAALRGVDEQRGLALGDGPPEVAEEASDGGRSPGRVAARRAGGPPGRPPVGLAPDDRRRCRARRPRWVLGRLEPLADDVEAGGGVGDGDKEPAVRLDDHRLGLFGRDADDGGLAVVGGDEVQVGQAGAEQGREVVVVGVEDVGDPGEGGRPGRARPAEA